MNSDEGVLPEDVLDDAAGAMGDVRWLEAGAARRRAKRLAEENAASLGRLDPEGGASV
jgi:hypothetical protein